MIIVNIKNGLGNQLFQYAFGKVLEWKYGEKVYFDFLRENITEPIETELNAFQLDGISEAEPMWRKPFLPFSVRQYRDKKQYLKYLYYKLRRKYQPHHLITESYPSQYLDIVDKIDPKKKYYFLGFWQNPRYFEGYESRIRELFQPVDKTIYESAIAREIIASTYDTVSLHFRRGDYKTSGFIEPLGMEYYEKAIQKMVEKLGNPFFYVFTDEPEWVEKNFTLAYPFKVVKGNTGQKAYVDILLMSICHHHIMANSTFSWWGAWLDANPEKIVIAPKKWYAEAGRDKFASEITPNNWLRL